MGPRRGLVQVGGFSLWADQEGWQATAQERATLRGIDFDSLESHIDYTVENDWDYM